MRQRFIRFLCNLPSAVCVRTALWCAPSFLAQFMSPGTHGAPAQCHVGMAREQGHVTVSTQKAVHHALKPRRQKAVICHHVPV